MSQMESFSKLKSDLIRKQLHPESHDPSHNLDAIAGTESRVQIRIDPHLRLLDGTSACEKSAEMARQERLKKIYERVLYRDGNPTAREQYRRYFGESVGGFDVQSLEQEIDGRREARRHIVVKLVEQGTEGGMGKSEKAKKKVRRSKSVGRKMLAPMKSLGDLVAKGHDNE